MFFNTTQGIRNDLHTVTHESWMANLYFPSTSAFPDDDNVNLGSAFILPFNDTVEGFPQNSSIEILADLPDVLLILIALTEDANIDTNGTATGVGIIQGFAEGSLEISGEASGLEVIIGNPTDASMEIVGEGSAYLVVFASSIEASMEIIGEASGTILYEGTPTNASMEIDGEATGLSVYLGIPSPSSMEIVGEADGTTVTTVEDIEASMEIVAASTAYVIYFGEPSPASIEIVASEPTFERVPLKFLTRLLESGKPMSMQIHVDDIEGLDEIGLGEALLIDGSNEMGAPINADPGTVTEPSIRNKDNNDTGIYFPGADQLAVTLGGVQRFLFENDGISLIIGSFGGKLTHNNTENEEYELPPWSGRIFVSRTSASGTNMTISVTTSAIELLPSDSDRIGGLITNNDPDIDIWVGLSNAVVVGDVADANGGVLITAGGGSFNLSQLSGYTGPVYALTESGTAIVSVMTW